MIAQNNVTHIFVGSDTALSTVKAPTVARTLGVKRTGEILCDATALVAGDGFQVLYLDAASKLQVSPVLYFNDIVSKKKVAATSDAAEVVAVGYNGTSGAIEVNNLGEYLLTIGYKSPIKMLGNKRIYRYGQFTADATATQYEIANGIQNSLLKGLAKDSYKMFKVEKINDGAQANAIAAATVSVTNGSNTIVTSDDETLVILTGTLLRFGTSGAGSAPVYKVTGNDGGAGAARVYFLDQPYQGATNATFGAATFETVTEGNYGLLITSLDSSKPFELGKWAFDPIKFDVGLSTDFGSTPVTINTLPAKGMGTYKEIATIEWELVGNRREAFRIAEYPLNINGSLGATVGETYTVYTINFKDSSTKVIGGSADSFITLMIAAAGANLTGNLDTVFGF